MQQHEYIPALAPDAGVRVLVHSRGTFPALEDDGFSVPVGFMTSVGVKLVSIVYNSRCFVCLFVCLMAFNATFNNISVISVLLVKETGGPGENHRPVASH